MDTHGKADTENMDRRFQVNVQKTVTMAFVLKVIGI